MDYTYKIDEIISLLRQNGLNEFADEITEKKSLAFTSTELLLSVVFTLKRQIGNNIEVFKLISNSVNELEDYCRKIGLDID